MRSKLAASSPRSPRTAAPALAHPAPFSYLDVRIDRPRRRRDDCRARVRRRPRSRPRGRRSGCCDAVDARRARAGGDGAPVGARCEIGWTARPLSGGAWSAPVALADRQSLQSACGSACCQPPGALSVSAWMFPYDPVHQTFVNVYERDDADAPGDPDEGPAAGRVTSPARGRATLAVVAQVRRVRRPPHSDRPGSPAVSRRPAPARRLAPPARAGRQRVHRRAQRDAVARGAATS